MFAGRNGKKYWIILLGSILFFPGSKNFSAQNLRDLGICKNPSFASPNLKLPLPKISQAQNEDGFCELFPSTPSLPPLSGWEKVLLENSKSALSGTPFWAQEYTGSDLVQSELKDKTFSVPDDLVLVFDSEIEFIDEDMSHGQNVSELIYSKHGSAAIPSSAQPRRFTTSLKESRADEIERFNSINQPPPAYISKSITPQIDDTQLKLALLAKGSVLVETPGNDHDRVKDFMEGQAKNLGVLYIGSLDELGQPTEYTNYGPAITISAPTGVGLLTFGSNGTPQRFAGTSGAVPQVTSALAAFTIASGQRLNHLQAKKVLEKTAIRNMTNLISDEILGPGMLNTYKIFALGNHLKKLCELHSKPDQCFSEKLLDDRIFDFDSSSLDRALLRTSEKIPSCSGKEEDKEKTKAIIPCDEKKTLLTEARKAAYLNPENPRGWQLVSCILESSIPKSQEAGKDYTLINQFYKNLQSAQTKDSKKMEKLAFSFFTENQMPMAIADNILPGTHSELVAHYLIKEVPPRDHFEQIAEGIFADSKPTRFQIKEKIHSQSEYGNDPAIVEKLLQSNSNKNLIQVINWMKEGKPKSWNHHKKRSTVEILTKNKSLYPELLDLLNSVEEWNQDSDLVIKIVEDIYASAKKHVENEKAHKRSGKYSYPLNGWDKAVVESVLSHKKWEDRTDWIEKSLQLVRMGYPEAIPEIVSTILKQENYKNREDLIQLLLEEANRGDHLDSLAKVIASYPPGKTKNELIKKFKQRSLRLFGSVDASLAVELSQSPYSEDITKAVEISKRDLFVAVKVLEKKPDFYSSKNEKKILRKFARTYREMGSDHEFSLSDTPKTRQMIDLALKRNGDGKRRSLKKLAHIIEGTYFIEKVFPQITPDERLDLVKIMLHKKWLRNGETKKLSEFITTIPNKNTKDKMMEKLAGKFPNNRFDRVFALLPAVSHPAFRNRMDWIKVIVEENQPVFDGELFEKTLLHFPPPTFTNTLTNFSTSYETSVQALEFIETIAKRKSADPALSKLLMNYQWKTYYENEFEREKINGPVNPITLREYLARKK